MSAIDNADILKRLRTSAPSDAAEAFESLFHTHIQGLTRFVSRYTGSLDTARDVVHDVFVRIWERRAELPDGDIAAYLYRAARNRALDLADHDAVMARWQVEVQGSVMATDITEPNAGDRALELAELSARLNRALATLSPRVREMVQLAHQEGMKPGEIATVLGVAPATVYSKLSRALKQLATVLAEE